MNPPTSGPATSGPRKRRPSTLRAEPREVFDRLREMHGRREWIKRRDPLDELVYTVLSQHTSDANTDRTFARLKSRFPDWPAVRHATPEAVADAIRLGGLSRIKAPRIQAILAAIQSDRGNLDLTFLSELALEDARDWLTALPGVGPKTAACVLLFSFGLPAMPVDTHVHRISKRLGLIGPKVPADKAHPIIEGLVEPEDVYQFHVDLIDHGRQICKAQRPRCGDCVLNDICRSSTV